MSCGEKDNVVAHLEDMESIYQQLSSRGTKIADEDYIDAIVRSLPRSYQNLVTSLLTIYDEMQREISPNTIKSAIRKEYEARQATGSNRNQKTNEIVRATPPNLVLRGLWREQ
jgi:polyribonucleotide nucleotidyltransferase